MARMSRREFLASAATVGAALAVGGRVWAAGGPKVRRGSDVVTLGQTSVRPTVLGLGTGTVGGREQRELGTEKFTRLVRHALDRGVRYIDTADAYMMHVDIQRALKGVPREKYFIQTKTRAKSAAVAKADIDRFRRELRVDYIDSVLMHCMTRAGWPEAMRPVLDVLLEEKRRGRIKAVGVSCHGWTALELAPACPDLDIHLVRINPFGLKMDAKPDRVVGVLRKMRSKGRGIIGMKIYGETGLENRKRRLESIRYVLGLGLVDCFTIGFSKPEQIDETLALIEEASAGLRTGRAPAPAPFAA